MTSEMNTKVRLVRCPTCWQVLPEMAQVPVYKCGGCDTILVAKRRKNETEDTGSQLHEAELSQRIEPDHVSEDREVDGLNERVSLPFTGQSSSTDKTSETNQYEKGRAQTNEPDHVSEDKEASGLKRRQVSLPSTGESSPDETSDANQYKFGDCNAEQKRCRNFSKELPSSCELICHENEDLSPEAGIHVKLDEDKCPLDQYNSMDRNGLGDIHGEWTEGGTCPNLLPTSTTCHENGESSPEAVAHEELDEEECPLDQYSNHQGLSSTVAGVQIGVDGSKYSLDRKNGRDQNKQNDCSWEEPRNVNGTKEVSSCTELTCHEIEEQSMVADMAVGGEMDEDLKSRSSFRSSGAENLLAIEPRNSITTPQRPLDDSHSSDDLTSPPKKQLEQSEKSMLQGFNPVSSVDVSENLVEMESSSSTQLTCHAIEEQSVVADMALGLEVEDLKSHSMFRSSSAENLLAIEPRDSITTTQKTLDDSHSSQDLTSPKKQLEHSPGFRQLRRYFENLAAGKVSSSQLTCHEIEEQSMAADISVGGEGGEVDEDFKSRSIFRNSSAENLLAIEPRDSITTPQRPLNDCHSSDDLTSPKKELEQSQKSTLQGFDRVNSVDTLENLVKVEVSSSTQLTCHEIEEQSVVAEMAVGGEVDEDFKSHSIVRSSSAENLLAMEPRDSITTTQRELDNGHSSDDLTCPPKKQLEQSQKTILQGFDRVSSVDTLENLVEVEVASSNQLTFHEREKQSKVAEMAVDGEGGEVDEDFKSCCIFRSSSAENLLAIEPRNSTTAPPRPLDDSNSSDDLTTTPKKQLEQSEKSILQGFNQVSSVETLGNLVEMESSSSTQLTCHAIEEQSMVAEMALGGEVEDLKSHSMFRSSSAESLSAREPRDSITTTQRPLNDCRSLDDLTSTKKELEQSQKSILQGFDPVSSADTMKNLEEVEVSSSTQLACHEIEEQSILAEMAVGGECGEVNEDFKSRSIVRSSSAENLLAMESRDSFTSQKPLDDSHSSDDLTCPPKKQLEQSQKSILQGFDRVSSVDTLENLVEVEVASSTQLTFHEIEKQSKVAEMAVDGEGGEVDEDFKSCCSFRSSSAEDLLAIEPRNSITAPRRPLDDSNSSDDLTTTPKKQLEQSEKSILQGFDHVSSVDTLKNLEEVEVSSSTQLACHEIEEQSMVAEMAVGGECGEVDEDFKSRSIFRISSAENLLAIEPRDSITTTQRPLDTVHSSEDNASPPKKQLEQSQKSILQGFDRVSSVDTFENLALVKHSSEVSAKHRDMNRFPTRRYYANDGSTSSFDGTDDQFTDRRVHLSKRNSKEANLVSTNGLFRRNGCRVNDVMNTGLEIHHQAMNPSSCTTGKKHHDMKSTKWGRDELPLPRRHSHPFSGMMGAETDEHPSKMPFYSRGYPSSHVNGIPSRNRHEEFQAPSSYYSPEEPIYPEPDKMELLRMVYELKDELNRTDLSKTKANRRSPADRIEKKQILSYYDHLPSEGDIYDELNHPGYPGRYMQGKNLPEWCKNSRMAFSGEVSHMRHQIDCSCLHCCPREWRSEQLPPHTVFGIKGRTCQFSHNRYNPSFSSPSSPQHYAGSEFSSWSHDIMSDDQWNGERKMKKLFRREKNHLIKQHFRPVAGGVSVVACYHCLKLLQLPADFLLFRRRCHRLKCSACSEVLMFSLLNRTHLVPYNNTNSINKRNVASTSCAIDRQRAESVQFSDDHGPSSFSKNSSTKIDPLSLPPLHVVERKSNDRKTSSGEFFMTMEEKKKSAPKALKKYQNPVIDMSSRGKLPLEIEELEPTKGFPLHRLMGYSSPSIVIKGGSD